MGCKPEGNIESATSETDASPFHFLLPRVNEALFWSGGNPVSVLYQLKEIGIGHTNIPASACYSSYLPVSWGGGGGGGGGGVRDNL